jgi:hypothetical protein
MQNTLFANIFIALHISGKEIKLERKSKVPEINFVRFAYLENAIHHSHALLVVQKI